MPAPPTLTVISLGGGVQPSVMALMASQGAFDRTPDCATFADGRPALTPAPNRGIMERQKVDPAVREHPGPWRHLKRQVMQ